MGFLGRAFGETGRVVEVDEVNRSVVVETESVKGQVARHGLELRQDRHWEHVDTSQKQVMGHEAWYVAVTRARDNLAVFTDSREKLPKVISQVLAKESAIEAVEKSQEKGRGMERER